MIDTESAVVTPTTAKNIKIGSQMFQKRTMQYRFEPPQSLRIHFESSTRVVQDQLMLVEKNKIMQ